MMLVNTKRQGKVGLAQKGSTSPSETTFPSFDLHHIIYAHIDLPTVIFNVSLYCPWICRRISPMIGLTDIGCQKADFQTTLSRQVW
jgi:hypothetical protein